METVRNGRDTVNIYASDLGIMLSVIEHRLGRNWTSTTHLPPAKAVSVARYLLDLVDESNKTEKAS